MGVVLALSHEIATLVNSYVFVQVFKDSHAQFVIISFYIIYIYILYIYIHFMNKLIDLRCIHGTNGVINQGL